jgi:predicted dithiol-disulfide oxidoreductase (DUF899 family)
MTLPKVASREEWLAARKELLAKEKQLTKARDQLNAERRALPMVEMDKEYVFEGPAGKATLLDMFEGRRQLIIYHFMFDPSWDAGCASCTGHVRDLGYLPHLHERDTTMALISRAPISKIEAYRERMGWTIPWYSSYGNDFNYDFHVTLDETKTPIEINFRSKEEHEKAVGPWDIWSGELPAISVFLRDGDSVYHTYSAYSRGLDLLAFSRVYLDLTPLGRQDG